MNATETNVDKVYFVDDGYLCLRDNVFPDGLIVATLQTGREPKEYAEHIVRCVNAHESLVEALEEIADLPVYDAKIGLTLQAVVSAYEWARTIARAAVVSCE